MEEFRLPTRALETHTAQHPFELGHTCSNALEVVPGEREQPHRRTCDDCRRPLPRQQEPDLAESVARTENMRLISVGAHFGLSLLDEVDGSAVVVQRHHDGTRFHLDLARRSGELVELHGGKLGEEREGGDPARVHDD